MSSAIQARVFTGTRDDVVLGYASRHPGDCYRVPMQESLPPLKASWDLLELEVARRPDTDNFFHHTGANHVTAPPDHGTRSELETAEQHVKESKGRSPQESDVSQTAVTVYVFETTSSENPAAFAAGS